mmetsp:Transcript_14763/g.41572  ORF Transcript_14763/g.41572 Transcript_14763/m.41572 type:complete len:302 (+) Transcript_14763:784-1689(+)
MLDNCCCHFLVSRETFVVSLILSYHPLEKPPVCVLSPAGLRDEGRHSASQQNLCQAMRGKREIGETAEAPEGLPKQAPFTALVTLWNQLLPDDLAVGNNAVCPEVLQVGCLCLGVPSLAQVGDGNRRGAPRPTLVKENNAEMVGGCLEPPAGICWPRGFKARAALQVQQEGQLPLGFAVGNNFPSKHHYGLALRIGVGRVVEWDLKLMVGDQQTRHLEVHPGHPHAFVLQGCALGRRVARLPARFLPLGRTAVVPLHARPSCSGCEPCRVPAYRTLPAQNIDLISSGDAGNLVFMHGRFLF